MLYNAHICIHYYICFFSKAFLGKPYPQTLTPRSYGFRCNTIQTKRTYPLGMSFLWWEGSDSNWRSRRRRIYSPLQLPLCDPPILYRCSSGSLWSRWLDSNPQPADYKSAALPLSYTGVWCLGAESNHRQADFQSAALPTELPRHNGDPERARTVDLQRDRLAL